MDFLLSTQSHAESFVLHLKSQITDAHLKRVYKNVLLFPNGQRVFGGVAPHRAELHS